MKAGPLRNKIEVQRVTTTRNDRGELVLSWTSFVGLYADIKMLSGRENKTAMQVTTESTWQIIVRYTPGIEIRSTDRIKYGNRIFDIISSPRDVSERHRMIEILAKEHCDD